MSSSSLVDSHHDGVVLGFELFLLSVDGISVGISVSLKPLESFGGCVLNDLLVIIGEVGLKLLIVESILHLEAVVFESVLGLDLVGDGFILSLVLFSIGDHLLDIVFGETTLLIGDCDFV